MFETSQAKWFNEIINISTQIKKSCLWACNSRTPNLHTLSPSIRTTVKLFCSLPMGGESELKGAPQSAPKALWHGELRVPNTASSHKVMLSLFPGFGMLVVPFLHCKFSTHWRFCGRKSNKEFYSLLDIFMHDVFLRPKSVWQALPTGDVTCLCLSSGVQQFLCVLCSGSSLPPVHSIIFYLQKEERKWAGGGGSNQR